MARLLLATATLALVWLFAFVAESRADSITDGLATTSEQLSDVLDPESSTSTSDAAAPDDGTPQADVTPPVTEEPVTEEPVPEPPAEPPVAEPPAEPPVTVPPTEPPVAEPPAEPPVAEPPVAEPPAEPPVAVPPTEPPVGVPPAEPPTALPTGHLPEETSGTTFPSADSHGTGGDEWAVSGSSATVSSPLRLLGTLGMAPTANGTTAPASSGGQSDVQKSVPPSPAPRSPWTPRPDKPVGGFAGGGVFGGSTGGASGGAPMVLAGLIGLLGLWQLFGSRLSTSTTPLHGAAPAFQLKRPG